MIKKCNHRIEATLSPLVKQKLEALKRENKKTTSQVITWAIQYLYKSKTIISEKDPETLAYYIKLAKTPWLDED